MAAAETIQPLLLECVDFTQTVLRDLILRFNHTNFASSMSVKSSLRPKSVAGKKVNALIVTHLVHMGSVLEDEAGHEKDHLAEATAEVKTQRRGFSSDCNLGCQLKPST